MRSNNPRGAGNQQERLSSDERQFWFLAGFVEGESSVHLAIKTHPSKRFGCYVQPEFFIYQHKDRHELLEMARSYFGVGGIRPKPGNPDVLVYSVISRRAVVDRIVPFLERCMVFSRRTDDFTRFIRAVRLLEEGHHRTPEGLVEIVRLGYEMNMGGKQRRIPLETVIDRILRGHTPEGSTGAAGAYRAQNMVRPPWRHGEPGGRTNDLATWLRPRGNRSA
jgi:hypothetical protein